MNVHNNFPKVSDGGCRWEDEGLLYSTPSHWNDDWFWLYCGVSWGCFVLTNDEMRDHHFNMLSPRYMCTRTHVSDKRVGLTLARADASSCGVSATSVSSALPIT
jgi:hypothetical protein